MEYQCIIYEKKDHIVTITLNRPERLNAMNQQMMKELEEVFNLLEEDDDTRVVVITGTGRGFCTGVDVEGTFQAGIEKREKGEANPSFLFPPSFSLLRPYFWCFRWGSRCPSDGDQSCGKPGESTWHRRGCCLF